jgi:hypothetical protein
MGITGGTKFAVTSDGKSIFLDIKDPNSGLADKGQPQRITICVDD